MTSSEVVHMEAAEVTIKQVADECGVSKSTAVRKLKELGLPVITRGGKGTVYLGPEAASALAHALVKSRAPEISDEEVSEILGLNTPSEADDAAFFSPVVDLRGADGAASGTVSDSVLANYEAIVASYRDQIRTLKETNATLRSQIDLLNLTIDAMRTNYESTVTILTNQVDRLGDQLSLSQREKERMRNDLAMSRALEGFHFPWQRERIMSQFMLPPGHMAGGSNEAAAGPAPSTPSGDEPTYETPL